MSEPLSAAEAELYDRQIRLWGIESQEKLRAANVLLIGVKNLGSEIAKNILLSGINSLVLLDDGTVTEADQKRNFLLNKDSIGKNLAEALLEKARELNPLVTLTADTSSAASKPDSFYENFTIIIATGMSIDFIVQLDRVCRAKKIKLIIGDVVGTFGFVVSDFQEHEYYEDQVLLTASKRNHTGDKVKTEKKTVRVKSTISYPDMDTIFNVTNTNSTEGVKTILKRNQYLLLMMTVLQFRSRTERDPELKNKESDINSLKDIKALIQKLFKLEADILNDNILEVLFDEIVPTCALVGGVIAQEVIKAVSQKEVPINNVFLFDPITYSGKEIRIGG